MGHRELIVVSLASMLLLLLCCGWHLQAPLKLRIEGCLAGGGAARTGARSCQVCQLKVTRGRQAKQLQLALYQ